VKEVAHGIHENALLTTPSQWLKELFGHQSEIEPLFEWMPGNATETLRERGRVAMGTPWADLRTAPYWIPGGICPMMANIYSPY